jgi:hypothetical protein
MITNALRNDKIVGIEKYIKKKVRTWRYPHESMDKTRMTPFFFIFFFDRNLFDLLYVQRDAGRALLELQEIPIVLGATCARSQT